MTERKSLSRRAVAWLCALLLLASLLPMYALALYNHAFYDDYVFSLLTSVAWKDTGSVFAVLEAAVRNTVGIRQTWEGTYATSFISTFQPAIFGDSMYWLTTFALLTIFLLAVWFFLRQTLRGTFGAQRSTVVTAFAVLGFVMVQFVPDAAEAFYWFNGGVAYTLLWSVMLFTAGVWIVFERTETRGRSVALYIALVLLTVTVGGAKYSTVLFAMLLAGCFTAWAFRMRRPKRWAYLSLTLLLMVCFAFSAMAAGNGVRAQTLSGGMSAPKAIAEAVYFGVALMGHFFSLPLLAALLLLIPLMTPALRQCPWRFAHPVWVTLLAACLFCAQLTPTLYTGNYLGDGRVMNTYYYTYVLTLAHLTVYWTGFALRRREGKLALAGIALPAPTAEKRLKAATLALVACMLVLGCVAYHPDGSLSYGPQNMAGGSALRSIMSGEGAAYDDAMDARDAQLNDPTLTDVTLSPIDGAPASFMGDALDSDNLEYVLNLYADYYDKASVSVAETEEIHAASE